MSVRYIVCDGCGKSHDRCDYLLEFEKHGVTVHLCDECIDIAKEMVDQQRGKENGR